MTRIETIELAKIEINGGTQQRAKIDEDTVADYARHYGNGVSLPPLEVFFDGLKYWLVDGFHRLLGAGQAKLESLEVAVTNGTQREAILASCGANAKNGLRRTNADKRKAVETILKDEEWGIKGDLEVSEICQVSRRMVCDVRGELVASWQIAKIEAREVTRNGKTYTQNTANIGKASPGKPTSLDDLEGSLDREAERLGIIQGDEPAEEATTSEFPKSPEPAPATGKGLWWTKPNQALATFEDSINKQRQESEEDRAYYANAITALEALRVHFDAWVDRRPRQAIGGRQEAEKPAAKADPLPGQQTIPFDKPPSKQAKNNDQSQAVLSVFDYYRTYHPQACPKPQADSKEWKLIKQRIKDGFTVEQLQQAIDGNHLSPFHCGENDRNTKYHGLKVIFQTQDKVNDFIEMAINPPNPKARKDEPGRIRTEDISGDDYHYREPLPSSNPA